MTRRTSSLITAAVTATLCAGLFTGISAATSTPSPMTFYGCKATSGAVSNITTSSKLTCKSGHKVVKWNAVGLQGLPGANGAPGAPGAPGPTGPQGGSGIENVTWNLTTNAVENFSTTVIEKGASVDGLSGRLTGDFSICPSWVIKVSLEAASNTPIAQWSGTAGAVSNLPPSADLGVTVTPNGNGPLFVAEECEGLPGVPPAASVSFTFQWTHAPRVIS
jgi:hypothetical protein